MINDETILFSPQSIAVLRQARFDPNATRRFEIMSGGFVWSDERLLEDVHFSLHNSSNYAVRALMGYRSSLIEGKPSENYRLPWDQLLRECPDWAGFRAERSRPSLASELAAEWRKVRRGCIQMERELRRQKMLKGKRRPWWSSIIKTLLKPFMQRPPTSPT